MNNTVTFFSFILLLALLPAAAAVSFSPSSLTFQLQPDEEECQTVTLDSDSALITVSDGWAPTADTEWNVNTFTASSADHDLEIDYPAQISPPQTTAAVCLKARQKGEYHGVVIFRQAQEGNSVVQVGVWIKATIQDRPKQSSNSGASASTRRSNTGGGAQTVWQTQQDSQTNSLTTNLTPPQAQSPEFLGDAPILTGAAVSNSSLRGSPVTAAIIVSLGIIGIIIFTFSKYKKWRKLKYGY